MTLWEYGALVHEWNERQPKDGPPPPLADEDMPDAEAWAQASAGAARVVAAAQREDKG